MQELDETYKQCEGTAETPAAGNPPAANPPGVTNSTAQADPNTIDVEAKTKS